MILFKTPSDFVLTLWEDADEAAAMIGLPASALLAQAANETGYGKHIPQAGTVFSYNLFGIKAGKSWTGPTVKNQTAEHGKAGWRQEAASFRVYASYAESFKGFVAFLKANARYKPALNRAEEGDVGGFFRALQVAGYATDPDYADKIIAIERRIKQIRS
ncbi:glycoside hydrolase family 73 protein [Candidatus Contendibacter odensensis]|uniref:Mannosyl-glycoprotein endo-beta-N-acetylglucosamidase-like domain-containing protein n=1 Tax=Candidatus Contendobacter odensis Run_B_J11 TaxID=1400861 RepID=A0A7U7GF63_9GAMM|nr:glucosaminidase domain-containing protein [Candidatus Contendobacter odensis]CDH46965.1 hypothetical protein BN874_690015 [Candidatus Contendobacter odensis Run_B_J11]